MMKRGTRAEQKAETRQRILEAAKAAFEARGFDGVNLREIAEEIGVVPGTILAHFADKRDLLHAALFDDLQATLDSALAAPPGASLAAWLDGLTDALFAFYEARPALSRVLLRESLLADPPWRERFAAQVATAHAAVAGRARSARDAGELPAATDPALFAAAYLAHYYFGLLAWAQGTHPDPRGLIRRLNGAWLAGDTRGNGNDNGF
jgi:AcrR family transcriptional regulator